MMYISEEDIMYIVLATIFIIVFILIFYRIFTFLKNIFLFIKSVYLIRKNHKKWLDYSGEVNNLKKVLRKSSEINPRLKNFFEKNDIDSFVDDIVQKLKSWEIIDTSSLKFDIDFGIKKKEYNPKESKYDSLDISNISNDEIIINNKYPENKYDNDKNELQEDNKRKSIFDNYESVLDKFDNK